GMRDDHDAWARIRVRNPEPLAAGICPAPIVVRRIPPRRIIDPRPTPRIDPHPVTGVIRRPARPDMIGNPHIAVTLDIRPMPILVEILIPWHLARDIPH